MTKVLIVLQRELFHQLQTDHRTVQRLKRKKESYLTLKVKFNHQYQQQLKYSSLYLREQKTNTRRRQLQTKKQGKKNIP